MLVTLNPFGVQLMNTPDREDPSIEYIPNRKVAIGVYLGILSQFCITCIIQRGSNYEAVKPIN